MEDTFVTSVLDLYQKGDWKNIVETYNKYPGRNKLLWVFPSEENFVFIRKTLKMLSCDRVLSIGCGSGLLEWMIFKATDIPVSGIEVDGTWWKCKYAPPTFIDLFITSPELDKDKTTIRVLTNCNKTAILFCYFNDGVAFKSYLKYFSGTVLIIIGPNKEGVHTSPKPFGDVSEEWTLYASQEVRDSSDFIAIYCKSDK
ncbi:unnamed protein product [Leptosia nina]|uniref:Uncharacterized protein n=1 Tax=Leptosia nina TaxID=320188 RepID=A0AAV1J4N4_9NEOP